MITYELAKKLKDAGWEKMSGKPLFLDGEVFEPSLSELIEACGDDFWLLTKNPDWEEYPMRWECDNFKQTVQTHGNTPEEAVANLWLELSKK